MAAHLLYGNYHGIEAYGTVSFNSTTKILTIGSGSNAYWYKGIRYVTASAVTCDLTAAADRDHVSAILTTNTLYFLYFKDASGKLYWSPTGWDLKEVVPFCTVYWNGSEGAVTREWHNYTRNIDSHIWAHKSFGARYYIGLDITKPTTVYDDDMDLTEGVILDEDLPSTITNAQSKLPRVWYQVAGGKYTFENTSLSYAGSLNDPKYATGTGLASIADNLYSIMWIYATPDIDRPIYIFPHTAEGTIAAMRAAEPPTLSGLGLNPEMKCIYKFIYKGDGEFQEAQNYRNVSSAPSGYVSAVNASSVVYTPPTGLTSTNVQAGMDEIFGKLRWNQIYAFSTTAASTSTITMTSDLTSSILPGHCIKFKLSGSYYRAICTAITSNLLTIAGAPLTTGAGDLTELYSTSMPSISETIVIDGAFADATDTALLLHDLNMSYIWPAGRAYLVQLSIRTTQDDSAASTQASINVSIAGSDVFSTALTVPDGTYAKSVVAIITANYDVNYGEAIELKVTAASGGTPAHDAKNLTAILTFVPDYL